jgi:iron(III) transport system substrate-binding protein
MSRVIRALLLAASAGLLTTLAGAQSNELNLYSARHYQTDEALYSQFTKATGIKINRVDADDAGILARLKAEGSASPADVILLVDAARLGKGQVEGLFRPIKSPLLEAAVPAQLRAAAGSDGIAWFGLSTRARVVVYDKTRVKREDVDTYEELADPKNKGRVCLRSGSHPYNLSLFGSMLEHLGPAKMENWLQGLQANLARAPKGGDTDQIRAVASGECAVAISNSYYIARLMRSGQAQDQALMSKVEVVFPNQQSWGTHLNIAGAAVARHSKNPQAAIQFIEYLASPQAQTYFADGNNEWPVVASVKTANPALQAMSGGAFKAETVPVAQVAAHQVRVQQMLDRIGFR